MNKITYILSFLILYPCILGVSVRIPNHLLECYRNSALETQTKLQVPMTIQLLIELIQRVEMSQNQVLDMRLTATSMIYRLKYDGIQRISNNETKYSVPVGPTAKHFNKFRLLVNYLLSGEEQLFPSEALSKSELCTLHLLISSSVQAWERGDETRTCPQLKLLPNDNSPRRIIQGKQKSICPIERGVAKSNWGDISAGHLLIAIAAALQKQDVKLLEIISAFKIDENTEILNVSNSNNKQIDLSGEVNNLWASTLAGDLAEVIMYQSPFSTNWIMGTSGIWNDTLIPSSYHLPDSIGTHWEMTSAETLGGIDGALIGYAVNKWLESMGRLRLSQIIDMYYSRKGVVFETNYRACERKQNIKNVLKTADLSAQTAAMLKLLQYYHLLDPYETFVFLPDELVEQYSSLAVDFLRQDLDALTDRHSACEKISESTALDILAILDNTWSEYEGRRLISALIDAADVSLYGSKIGFINGHTGEWMTNVTNRIFQIFEDLSRPDLSWPASLSLSNSLSTIVKYLHNKTDRECISSVRSTRNSVILVLGSTSTVNTLDIENSQSLIKSIKNVNPSITILYVASDVNMASYNLLANNEFLNDVVIESDVSIAAVAESVSRKLKDIPAQIIELYCDVDKLVYEDYITPKEANIYEIPYTIFQATGDIKVEFRGHDYGELSVCGNDKEYPDKIICKGIIEHGNAEFTTKQFCENDDMCTVQFKVTVKTSKNKCSEDDCRFPDQARISIYTSWSSSITLTPNLSIFLLAFCFLWLTKTT